jgi:hypothetical protein
MRGNTAAGLSQSSDNMFYMLSDGLVSDCWYRASKDFCSINDIFPLFGDDDGPVVSPVLPDVPVLLSSPQPYSAG